MYEIVATLVYTSMDEDENVAYPVTQVYRFEFETERDARAFLAGADETSIHQEKLEAK